jgi:outer membrane protein W
MKKNIAFTLTALMLFFCSAASAQFVVGIQGSYHTASDADRNDQIGKGLQGKYFFKNKMVAVGVGMRSWLKNYEKLNVAGVETKSFDAATSLAAMVEVYFSDKRFRPYVGTDIAAYASNINIAFKSQSGSFNAENKSTHWGIAPKSGILWNAGVVSPFVQAQYHFLFNGKYDGVQPEVSNAKSSFATFDIGLLFQFGKCGCAEKKKNTVALN